MTQNRITQHPVLEIPERLPLQFTWNGEPLTGYEGEVISSALIANGIHIFGLHYKDLSPQGLFCANGQCSQCLVMADGLPVKSCMTPLIGGMSVQSMEGMPRLPEQNGEVTTDRIDTTDVEVVILGAGPAGLTAAIELGGRGADVLIVDDKDRLGGKLVLQTHKFFGSVEDSYAGTRGFEIAAILEDDLRRHPSVRVWLNSTAVGVFSDGIVGIVKDRSYRMIRPKKLLVATGAREKMLSFPGNTLPGVYGAGAFQTLVNRDRVRSSQRVLIVGGGNVGLIGGYHAIQAGIEVAALIEALPEVGGYKVHADKLVRLGVPIHTRHTILAARGTGRVESATIARLDDNWRVIHGTEKTYEVDTVLIAVGLSEVNEFYLKAKAFGVDVFSAGDAQEIAEASAAMFTGRIEGFKIAKALGRETGVMPASWNEKAAVLKARPGQVKHSGPTEPEEGVIPVFHCYQEVPCNPCASVCPIEAVHTEEDRITGLPYRDADKACTGCLNCVGICPGLAITLVDYRKDPERPIVTLPYEVWRDRVEPGQKVPVTDKDGAVLGRFTVRKVRVKKKMPRTLLIQIPMDRKFAQKAVGIRVQEPQVESSEIYEKAPVPDDAVICRCERVSAGEIRSAIRSGMRDINQIKALTRAGMGSCGSKTCRPMIWRIFQEEGVDLGEVTERVDRPLFVEVPMGYFAGVEED